MYHTKSYYSIRFIPFFKTSKIKVDFDNTNNIRYIIGIARNQRLEKMTSNFARKAEKQYNRTGKKAKLFYDIYYVAKSWEKTVELSPKLNILKKVKINVMLSQIWMLPVSFFMKRFTAVEVIWKTG